MASTAIKTEPDFLTPPGAPDINVLSREKTGEYFELKYVLEHHKLPWLKALLEQYMVADRNYGKGSNVTLYYDTPNLDCYHEGLDGDNLKHKLRLRKYVSDTDVSYALECKLRHGTGVSKGRVRFRSDRFSLDDALSAWVPSLDPSGSAGLMDGLRFPLDLYRPSVLVEYRRLRYFCFDSETRVNIDFAIRGRTYYRGRGFPLNTVVELPQVVFEIKSPHFPHVPQPLARLGLSRSAFSKYGALMGEYGARFGP